MIHLGNLVTFVLKRLFLSAFKEKIMVVNSTFCIFIVLLRFNQTYKSMKVEGTKKKSITFDLNLQKNSSKDLKCAIIKFYHDQSFLHIKIF